MSNSSIIQNSKNPVINRGGRKTKYSLDMCQTAEKIMFETGKYEDVYTALDVSSATFYRWLKEKKELNDAVSRAYEERLKYTERKFTAELQAAFEGLNKLLTGYDKEFWEETRREIRNEETGKVMETIDVIRRQRFVHVRPDMRAIEKVLGPNDLRHNLYLKALEEHVLNHRDELYRLIFGKLGVGEEVEEFKGIFVLQSQVDLLKIRYMEAHIQGLYDRGDLTVEQWIDFTQRLRRDYGQISDRMEQRAQKLLQGASYSEIVTMIEEFWMIFIETAADLLGQPHTLNDGEEYTVPLEVQHQISEGIVDAVHARQDKKLFAIKRLPRP
ncbi:MAG: hypothetical protein FVQ79_08400 [Planctomycetes bacterium]|nr:hypothetical protein [Planctomycetota bacterium]